MAVSLSGALAALRDAEEKFLEAPITGANSLGVIVVHLDENLPRNVVLAALHAGRRMFIHFLDEVDPSTPEISSFDDEINTISALSQYHKFVLKQFNKFFLACISLVGNESPDLTVPAMLTILSFFQHSKLRILRKGDELLCELFELLASFKKLDEHITAVLKKEMFGKIQLRVRCLKAITQVANDIQMIQPENSASLADGLINILELTDLSEKADNEDGDNDDEDDDSDDEEGGNGGGVDDDEEDDEKDHNDEGHDNQTFYDSDSDIDNDDDEPASNAKRKRKLNLTESGGKSKSSKKSKKKASEMQKKKLKASKTKNGLFKQNKLYETAWLTVLKIDLYPQTYKRVLIFLPDHVLPYIPSPLKLADFFTDSYDHFDSGFIRILALNGLFILMQRHGLNYSKFYDSLYQTLQPSIFYAKHRARFFRLLTLCLSSASLPAYITAAFIKKLNRLSLGAPPSSALYVLALTRTLLRKHVECMSLIQKKAKGTVFIDPFNHQASDPLSAQASDSSLFELYAMKSHYHPSVSTLCKELERKWEKHEIKFSMEEYTKSTYKELFEFEIKRKMLKTPLNFEKPKGKFFDESHAETFTF